MLVLAYRYLPANPIFAITQGESTRGFLCRSDFSYVFRGLITSSVNQWQINLYIGVDGIFLLY